MRRQNDSLSIKSILNQHADATVFPNTRGNHSYRRLGSREDCFWYRADSQLAL